jgi:hypothetical protein
VGVIPHSSGTGENIMASRPFLAIDMLAGLASVFTPKPQYHSNYRERKAATKTNKARERRERRRRAEKLNIGNQFRYGVNWS